MTFDEFSEWKQEAGILTSIDHKSSPALYANELHVYLKMRQSVCLRTVVLFGGEHTLVSTRILTDDEVGRWVKESESDDDDDDDAA